MRKARSKGVSTVIGMAIFLTIFALAASYTFVWSQQLADYGSAAKRQLEMQQQRSAESLIVEVVESQQGVLYLDLINPTDQVVIVTQVWSAHKCQEGEWGIPPFSRGSINITISNPGDAFKVVTLRGNVFSAEKQVSVQRWKVTWYNATGTIGQSYWNNLDISVKWIGDLGSLGFNATTSVVTLGSDLPVLVRKTQGIPITIKLGNLEYNITQSAADFFKFKISPSDINSVQTLTVYLPPTNQDVEVFIHFFNLDFAR